MRVGGLPELFATRALTLAAADGSRLRARRR